MPVPHILFDFDGTLADSFSQSLAAYNHLAPRLNLKPAPPEQVADMRKMGAGPLMRALGIPMWKLPRLMIAARAELQNRIQDVQPFPGMADALRDLAAAGTKMAILTSNSRENVATFLARHQLGDFLDIDAGASLFGKGTRLSRLLKDLGCAPACTAYVGDTVPDIRAAREAGIIAVAVAWGYSDRVLLEAENPDALVDRPEDLARVLLDLTSSDL
jgi:phosphoglycolate phosphatase